MQFQDNGKKHQIFPASLTNDRAKMNTTNV